MLTNTIKPPTSTLTNTVKPEKTSTAVQTPVPSITSTPKPGGILANLGEPQEYINREEALGMNIKEEIYFIGGPGGSGQFGCETQQNINHPGYGWINIIQQDEIGFCAWGFLNYQDAEVEIFDPVGNFVASKTFSAADTRQELNQFYYFWERNGVSGITFNLWFPPSGIPLGTWNILVRSSGVNIEGKYNLYRSQKPKIMAIHDLNINPFVYQPRSTYKSGDKIFIVGYGYQPDDVLSIGLYYYLQRESRKTKWGWASVAKLIYGRKVSVDRNGIFWFTYNIKSNDYPGYYYIATYDETNQDVYCSGDSCPWFKVDNSMAATPTLSTWLACKNAPLSQLRIGNKAYVSFDPPDPNTVRGKPGKESNALGKIYPGEEVEILDGPSCKDSLVWWKVRSTKTGLIGWTAEGDYKNYWIIPKP